MTGFHFTGTAVHALPELRFPFFRIPGSLGLEYSPWRYLYFFLKPRSLMKKARPVCVLKRMDSYVKCLGRPERLSIVSL